VKSGALKTRRKVHSFEPQTQMSWMKEYIIAIKRQICDLIHADQADFCGLHFSNEGWMLPI
jgi:hypothetical protein